MRACVRACVLCAHVCVRARLRSRECVRARWRDRLRSATAHAPHMRQVPAPMWQGRASRDADAERGEPSRHGSCAWPDGEPAKSSSVAMHPTPSQPQPPTTGPTEHGARSPPAGVRAAGAAAEETTAELSISVADDAAKVAFALCLRNSRLPACPSPRFWAHRAFAPRFDADVWAERDE